MTTLRIVYDIDKITLQFMLAVGQPTKRMDELNLNSFSTN